MTTNTPNIIVILADDLGYGDLSIYGNNILQTPHLDRLAQEGLRLSQHYSGSPLCAPARAALLTGRYNHRTGALSVESNRGLDRIALRERTIADVFKRAGYATGMVGKWHNGLHDMRYHPNQRGFDEFVGFLNGGMGYWDWLIEYNGIPAHSDSRYLTDVFTSEAIDFIKRHRAESFFLYLSYNAPHAPLEAPTEDVTPYLEHGEVNEAVATLYGMIQRMDKGIGQILETLDREGLADNTLILFTSDNGPHLGMDQFGGHPLSINRYNGPFRGMKQDVLEGGIRVPAIVRWPDGVPQGSEIQPMFHFCDWLPTVMASCGIEVLPELPLDGVNQLSALRNESGQINPKRFWQFNRYDPVLHCNGAMRDGDWKLYWPRIPEAMVKLRSDVTPYRDNFHQTHHIMPIQNPPVERTLSSASPPELYNLAEDPAENHNLSETYPDRLAKMQFELENWVEAVHAERLQYTMTNYVD